MPRKRKTGGSPSRKSGNFDRTAFAMSLHGNPRLSIPQAMYSVNKEELFNSMSEMFSDLDPSVVYMVLSECDFKVESAMDYLLELSTHAKGVASSKIASFDPVVSSVALVNQQRSDTNERVKESTAQENSSEGREEVLAHDMQLTEELDSLIENAFVRYSFGDELPDSADDQIIHEHAVGQDNFSAFIDFSEWEKPDAGCNALFPQEVEMNNESFENLGCSQPPVPMSELSIHTGVSSPAELDPFAQALGDPGLSEMPDVAPETYKQCSGDVPCGNSHQIQNTVSDPENVTVASGGAFQKPVEQVMAVPENPNSACLEQHRLEMDACSSSSQSSFLPEVNVSLEKSNFKTPEFADFQQSQQGHDVNFSAPPSQPQQHWNPLAPQFYPSSGSHSFVTPVAASPGQWRPFSDYKTFEMKGLYFSSPVVSNAWDSNASLKVWGNQDRNSKLNHSQAQQPPVCHMMRKKMHLIGQVLVLLRGVPGSGKSFLARALLEDNPGGIILSTDDYFYKNGQYHYDASCLGEAHDWNRKRAKEAFEKRVSPIIIDNTNIQAWEMKPYVTLAQQFKYKVMFREPDTWWKFKPKELERRNIHGISKEKIKRMLERYERCLSVSSILNSSVPEKSEAAGWSEDSSQEESSRRETHSDVKEERPFASKQEPLASAEDKTPLSATSLILENNSAPGGFQEEEKELEKGSVEHSSENTAVQDDLDICLSDREEKVLLFEKKEEKGENIEGSTETEVAEVDVTSSEGAVCLQVPLPERAEEGSDKSVVEGETESSEINAEPELTQRNDVVEGETEVEQHSEINAEPELTQTNNVVEPSSSVLDMSGKPELLNFLGDWPIEQTMGQRVKRPRRLEKSSKTDKEGKTPSQLPFELGKEQVGLPDSCTVEKRLEEENVSVSSDKIAPELQMVGHWPLSGSLEQRQQRSRRVRKTSLNQSDEGMSTKDDSNRNALDTVDVLRGTPVDTLELQDTKKLQPEAVASETTTEKKNQQNKRTRKHHKLALTFTNNNLPPPRAEEQLSVLMATEEKHDTCSYRQVSSSSQTESQDFALLWRLEKKMLFPETAKVLHGRLDGFRPKDVDGASESQEKIPYRVTYDKSTFVEESELINIDESEKLSMLCKLFESLSVEAVKDLYERCNKDIDWVTGLLLDSDEKLFKDVSTECLQTGEAEAVATGPDFKANASCGENPPNPQQTQQVFGKEAISEGPENKNSLISVAEGSTTTVTGTGADISDSLTAVCVNDSAEHQNPSDAAPGIDAAGSAADITEQTMSEMQKIDRQPVSTAEETQNKQSASPLDAGLCGPVTSPHGLHTTPANLEIKLNNENGSNLSESGTENGKVHNTAALLLEMDQTSQKDPTSNKELESDKETQGRSREVFGKEKNEPPNWDAQIENPSAVPSVAFNIDCLELTLPPELALQLKEIFGPVGIDAGSLTVEDCVVHIDLNLAKVIHEKWKESILKRQRREDESRKLLAEGPTLSQQTDTDDSEVQLSQNADSKKQNKNLSWISESSNDIQTKKSAASEAFPFMDHWNAQIQKVSLRQIISEEIAMQEKQDLKRVPSMARKDCAAKLKEKQLFEMFPTINQNFLMDIFKDNNYSLEQTEQFLNCVLEADPVKTVVAQESAQQNETVPFCSAAKNREKKAKKSKEEEDTLNEMIFQDFEYPQYDDLRAEAFLHQQKRQESLKKAGEAYRMGMKPVAAFYAQQGRLHEQKMKEANHAAAMQIFEKVNTSLLPMNVLDLHGLHVDEAVNELSRVLQEKSEEHQRTGGKPYLYVITGRGSHSQGGVARIKPAAIRYLTSHNFRFTEIKSGCLKVMLS
ncbi:NEDD4-binding protein 2 isoform X2 [Nothoprocta perdicaria]|uniref:NEDD4-binding protein 2 isoform X2 n=1 Tax=Nothoprocta perdicaria TaxID=30464 RepID=UPI000E1B694F|nr:NEDD4-binding protein 2 isoform X2 [Nothoprocta perdicaria]